ncbi:uncharacterized protein AMSG_06887 [Thecamonas trahens ATCC 50062]|uniref:EF-hand domain-containing protein n=1 Tax=Thecamonas trahens ATCC 50062 TaxID=461836 RepID=A0A0L0DE15_THETB|nr:hypothetical protein AMSG_06887 [Thecamonas trahens ATCC 50062]KNC50396.1 hypothetical protein AMSG_06887 [Thecamonas trahens ATCC 50062]|eukprot:XP_013756938.1 hypothetical protein AMSG_06887 [Thecamonas trahens ATCC 50062]
MHQRFVVVVVCAVSVLTLSGLVSGQAPLSPPPPPPSPPPHFPQHPSDPVPTARFTSTSAEFDITFSNATDRAGAPESVIDFDCGILFFDISTLGTSPVCRFVTDAHVNVALGSGATAMPGDVLFLAIEFKAAAPAARRRRRVEIRGPTSITLLAPLSPQPLVAALLAPPSVDSCGTVTLDASASSGIRLLYQYALLSPHNTSDALAVSSALAATPSSQFQVSLAVDSWPEGVPYVFRLTVTDWLGATDNTTTTIVKDPGAPQLTLSTATALVSSRTAFALSVDVAFASCSSSSTPPIAVAWSTSAGPDDPITAHGIPAASNTLNFPPGVLTVGGSYIFEVNVNTTDGSAKSASASATVTVKTSALVAFVAGGSSQTFHSSLDVVLDGSGSYDPDAAGALTYLWTCTDVSAGGACVSSPSSITWNAPTLTLPASLITVPVSDKLSISLTVSAGARLSVTTITVTRAVLPFEKYSLTWRDADLVQNVNDFMILTANVVPAQAGDVIEYLWDEASGKLNLEANNTLATLTRRENNFGIRANVMVPQVEYEFRLFARVIRNSGSLRSSLTTRAIADALDSGLSSRHALTRAYWAAHYPGDPAALLGTGSARGTRAVSPYFHLASHVARVNAVPVGGTFTAVGPPASATADTLFTFVFSGWSDGDGDVILYSVVQELASGELLELVPKSVGTSHSVYLQPGRQANNYQVSVLGYVTDDRAGRAAPVKISLRVQPFAASSAGAGATAESLVDGILSRSVELGNVNQALQLISSISDVVNSAPSPTPSATPDPTAVRAREKLFAALQRVAKVNGTADDLARTSSTLGVVLGVPREVSAALLDNSLALTTQLFSSIGESYVTEEQGSGISRALAGLFRAANANASLASVGEVTSGGDAVSRTLELVPKLARAVMADAVDGMIPLVASNAMFRFEGRQHVASSLGLQANETGSTVPSGVDLASACGAIRLPTSALTGAGARENDSIRSECIAFSENIYAWAGGRSADGNSSRKTSGALVSLSYRASPVGALSIGASTPLVTGELAVTNSADAIFITVPLTAGLTCACNHLTTFGLNTLDASDFERLRNIKDQPEALIVVVLGWAALLIALPFLHLADRKDALALLHDRDAEHSVFLQAKLAALSGRGALLKKSLKDAVTRKHLWMSLFIKAKDDPFTRVFRAGVLFTTLVAGLAMAAAFFKDQSDDEVVSSKARIVELVVSIAAKGTIYGLLPKERHWLQLHPGKRPIDAVGKSPPAHMGLAEPLPSLSVDEQEEVSSSEDLSPVYRQYQCQHQCQHGYVLVVVELAFGSEQALLMRHALAMPLSTATASSSESIDWIRDALDDGVALISSSSSSRSSAQPPPPPPIVAAAMAHANTPESGQGGESGEAGKGKRWFGICCCRKKYAPSLEEMVAALPPAVVEAAWSDYHKMDLNHDGTLDEEEVAVMMAQRGWILHEREVYRLMEAIDTDHNGVVDFYEYLALVAIRLHKIKEEEKALRHGSVPAWGGWLLFGALMIISLVSSLLVIVYGLKFSRPVVHSWLRTFAFNVVLDTIFFEPLKVFTGVLLHIATVSGAMGLADVFSLFG